MYYTNLMPLKEELSLVALIVILLLYDIFGSPKSLKYFQPTACILMGIHTLLNLFPGETASAFGGMYHYEPMGGIVKTILNIGTLLISCRQTIG